MLKTLVNKTERPKRTHLSSIGVRTTQAKMLLITSQIKYLSVKPKDGSRCQNYIETNAVIIIYLPNNDI